jgi:hypothetical protein
MNKLLKLIRPESLARARKRIKRNLRESAKELTINNIMREGWNGYKRDEKVYGL